MNKFVLQTPVWKSQNATRNYNCCSLFSSAAEGYVLAVRLCQHFWRMNCLMAKRNIQCVQPNPLYFQVKNSGK
uniref:Uncharacterized protein n=1 Tax=Anguilla anguilla TaxID=7936 RepID=A0A0E9WXQ7_ANGAN